MAPGPSKKRTPSAASGRTEPPGKKSKPKTIGPGKRRKQARGEIKTTFAEIIAQAPISILVSRAGKILLANRKFEESFGLGGPAAAIGRPITDFVTPRRREENQETKGRRRRALPVPDSYESIGRRADGREFPVRISTREVRLPDGPADLSELWDISAEKKAEKSRRTNEKTFQHSFEASVFGKAITRLDGRIRVNKVTADMFGYSIRDIEGRNWRDYTHPDDIEETQKNIDLQLSGKAESVRFTKRYIHKDGHTVWADIGSILRRDEEGRPLYLITEIIDITNHKRAEEALRESEARAKAMFQAIPDLMFRLDRRGVFLDYKADLRDLYAQSDSSIIGRRNRDITPPEFADLIDRFIRATLETKALQTFEYQLPIPGRGLCDYEARMVASGADEVTAIVRDITERKQTEEALSESHDRLDLAVQSARMGTWAFDIPADRRIFDERTCRLLGLDPARFRGTQEEFFSSLHPDDRQAVREDMIRTIEGSAPLEPTYRAVRPDGSVRYIAVRGRLTRSPDGRPLRVDGIAWDETERRQSEVKLAQSERRFRQMAEMLPQIVFETDIGGRITFANQHGFDAFGYSHEEVRPGLNIFSLFSPRDRENIKARFAEVVQGSPVEAREYELMRKDGKKFPVLLHATVILDEDIPRGIRGIAIDITERKKMEEALRKSESLLRSILDATPFPIALVDDQGDRIDFWSRSALALFGHTAPSATEWYRLAYPDIDYRREVIERWKPALEKARRSGEAVNTGTYRITCRDGSERVCELYAAFLADRLVVTFNDITERLRAEEQVQQSLREKELLLREVYHRTKNNMNVITALLSLRSENSRDPAVIQTFKDIEYRIKAMALVHQKLYQSLDLSRIDMGEYLSDLSSLLVKTAPGSMGRIALEFDMIPLQVPIDVAIPLGLIVTELFSNVIKHALRKNGEVRVRLGLSRLGTGDIELTFSDDGVGVPPGFDFRTGRTLGLQMVIMLVEHQLRGRVEFEGSRGVSCRIRIPAPSDPDGTRP